LARFPTSRVVDVLQPKRPIDRRPSTGTLQIAFVKSHLSRKPSHSTCNRLRTSVCSCCAVIMRSSFALSALTALASAAPYGPQTPLKNILENTDKSDKYTYPTDFTRNILPKPFHSHNDYWRDVPFYSGLSQGAISTEADVWLLNGTLYVSTILLPRDRSHV